MKVRGVEIRKGDKVFDDYPDLDGYWEVESLKPFVVMVHQRGKSWKSDIMPTEWVEFFKEREEKGGNDESQGS